MANVVRRCRELPGQELFQYIEADGSLRRIGSGDVNAWLAEVAGTRVTAKDFRTWHGSVQALELTLAACAEGALPCRAQEVLAQVARRLGNTPAVCRKAYVHPQVLALGAALADAAARAAAARPALGLKPGAAARARAWPSAVCWRCCSSVTAAPAAEDYPCCTSRASPPKSMIICTTASSMVSRPASSVPRMTSVVP